jgi:drug/metabolite transporter (DMT)-like permease
MENQMTPNMRGGIAVCVAMFLFVINDTLVKLTAGRLPSSEIMALRGVVAVSTAFVWCRQLGLTREIWEGVKQPFLLIRAAQEGMIAFTFITALAFLTLPDITAILLLTPLLITALSVPFLGEKVGWRRFCAIIIGFIGMLFVMKPTGVSLGWPGLIALSCALLNSVREISTRRMKPNVSSHVAMLFACSGVLILGLALSFTQTWLMPTLREALLILCAGIVVMVGNYYVVIAYRDTDVSFVSALRYSVIIFAIISGFIVFGDVPDMWGWIGISLIVASGLYTMYREKRLNVT